MIQREKEQRKLLRLTRRQLGKSVALQRLIDEVIAEKAPNATAAAKEGAREAIRHRYNRTYSRHNR